MEKNNTAKASTKQWQIYVGGVLAYAVIVVVLVWNYNAATSQGLVSAGEFGDLFGFSNTIFSGLAFVVLIMTLTLQQRELQLQRRELELARSQHRRVLERQLEGQIIQYAPQIRMTVKTRSIDSSFQQNLVMYFADHPGFRVEVIVFDESGTVTCHWDVGEVQADIEVPSGHLRDANNDFIPPIASVQVSYVTANGFRIQEQLRKYHSTNKFGLYDRKAVYRTFELMSRELENELLPPRVDEE